MRFKPIWLALVLVLALVPLPVGANQDPPPPPGPDFLTGPNEGDPDDIAVDFMEENAEVYGLRGSDVSDLVVVSSYRSSHNGVTHVNLNQQYEGLEVFGGYATVNIADDGSVIFVGNSMVGGLGVAVSGEPETDAVDAVEAAADALDLDEPSNLRLLSSPRGVAQETVISGGGISDEPIPARLGWQPTGKGLRLAWQLVIDDTSADHLWNTTVDAETGELLGLDDWTAQDNLTDLRNALGRPATLAGSSVATATGPDIVTPNPVNDGSSYRVFAAPKESPNDGPRSLVTNPADADASPWGWHDTTGTAAPDFTITRGNNVHAYLDQDANNQPDFGSEPDGGPGLTFDNPVDLDEHAQNYRDAVVTNLFYWNNVFHDVMWHFGFDEPSGNFQVNNYGRGGVGGDFVRAEAADGNGTNNANFSTPAADGSPPRMQMYLWPGNQFGGQNQLVIDGVGSFDAGWARFTPAPTVAGLPGRTLVYAATGCNAGLYPTLPTGDWFVVVDGGTGPCSYLQRVQVAESLGADAVVVVHTADSRPILSGSLNAAGPGIPAVSVTNSDGNAIKDAIGDGFTTGNLRKHPNHPGIRDGDFETGIIIHEYTHGVSLRLTGGPGINCLSGQEQMGEGWSDWYALAVLLDPELDDPQGPRGMGPYALFQDSRQGNGIRPRPYSRNMNIQPFTYDMIKTNGWITGGSLSVPHGIGHGWAAVLWDITWDLIDKHGFNPDVYGDWSTGGNNRALQLVTDGLKFQGCNPGFVAGRDAIIAAESALTGGEDRCILWRAFARRGLGYSAIQGTTNRNDNDQAFDLPQDCVRNQSRTLPLLGENEVGGGDPDGSGGARLSWDQSGKVCFDIRVEDIGTVTAAHIHVGGHGANGGIVVNFDTPNNGLKGCVTGVAQSLLEEIRTSPSQYYVNVHTTDYPAGALRGQLT